MSCRDDVLAAFERLERRHEREAFSPAEVVDEVQAVSGAYAESTIRTHVVSVLCADAPVNHGTTYRDLKRVAPGLYQRRSPGEAAMGSRDMRLVDGRRAQIKDLIDIGLLEAGDVLEFKRSDRTHVATVTEAGMLRLGDGREFATPSRAAMESIGRKYDGWVAYARRGDGTTLFDLRERLLEEATKSSPVDQGPAVDADVRRGRLTRARAEADAGRPTCMKVRELLQWWNTTGWDHRVVDRVAADLDNRGLETRPDFRKVSADTDVEIVRQLIAPEDPPPSDGVRLDVGLTLGNVPSALNGITSVHPSAPLSEAMTIMRLNDFSQLAVMSSRRKLDGAVTWRSIAKALAHDPRAPLRDALESASDYPYDRDLVDVLGELFDHDFVFVRNNVTEVAGIVTAADVVQLYGRTATPYFIVGEIDHLLRGFIADTWTVEQVIEVCDPAGKKHIASHDDLTFGDYVRMLDHDQRFRSLGWPLDRGTFTRRLDAVRQTRNRVAHFAPDQLGPDDLPALQHLLKLLRELRSTR